MLEFPQGFFEAENREDFLVDQTMKTVWAAEMEVLQEIAVICQKHHLTWYAAYGTLLGAVRHEGFIPWDDDIDIWMKRKDYEELLEILPGELPEGWRVKCPLKDSDAEEYQCWVGNGDSISIEPERLERFHGCPFIVGIDIFPLDYLPEDEKKRAVQKNLFLLARQAAWMIKFAEETPEKWKDIEAAISEVEAHCHMRIDRGDGMEPEARGRHLRNQLWRAANLIAASEIRELNVEGANENNQGKQLTMYVNFVKHERMALDASWFDEVEYLPFEQVLLPVPKDYDAVLRAIYGNYETPVRSKTTHDYPIYLSQLEELRRVFREKMPNG